MNSLLAFQIFEGQNPSNIINEMYKAAQEIRKRQKNIEWKQATTAWFKFSPDLSTILNLITVEKQK